MSSSQEDEEPIETAVDKTQDLDDEVVNGGANNRELPTEEDGEHQQKDCADDSSADAGDDDEEENIWNDPALRVPVLVPRSKIFRTATFLNRILPFAARGATDVVKQSLVCRAWRGFFVEGHIPAEETQPQQQQQQQQGSNSPSVTNDAAVASPSSNKSTDGEDDDAFVFLFTDDAVSGADPIWKYLVGSSLTICSNSLVDFTLLNATWAISHMARVSDELSCIVPDKSKQSNIVAAAARKKNNNNIKKNPRQTKHKPFFFKFERRVGIARGGAALKAFMTAVELERTEIVRILMDAAAVDILAWKGASLIRAAEIGNVEMMRVLLRSGRSASGAASAAAGAAATAFKAKRSDVSVVRSADATTATTPISAADLQQHNKDNEHMSNNGSANIIGKNNTCHLSANIQPATAAAAVATQEPNQVPSTEKLANINTVSWFGQTMLSIAALRGDTNIAAVNFLLSHGAKVARPHQREGATMLHSKQSVLDMVTPFARKSPNIAALLQQALDVESDAECETNTIASKHRDEDDEEEAPPPPDDEDDAETEQIETAKQPRGN